MATRRGGGGGGGGGGGESGRGDSPPRDAGLHDSLEFLTTRPNKLVNVKTLVNPIPGPSESMGRSELFSITPAIVHFGGMRVGELHEHVVSVVNISKTSQRLSIYPATSGDFFADFEKQGSLAPGMSQKIVIKFRPKEYKYYHDYIRIQTVGQRFILVPIHAYPVLNKLDFPRNITFGQSPLCETMTKTITLQCSVPVDFSFDLEVVKPHPYFRIEPQSGIIPANGQVTVTVTFLPITLGSCFVSMKLHIGQYGWVPMDCDISAKAVSGLLESRELKDAQVRLMDYIKSTGDVVNNALNPNSTFRGDLTFNSNPVVTMRTLDSTAATAATAKRGAGLSNSMLVKSEGTKNHLKDPTAALLANTFKATDLNQALDLVLQRPDLLSTKVNDPRNEFATGIRGVDGVLKAVLPAKPRGTGSGIVFDAGVQWMTLKQQKIQSMKMAAAAGASSPGGGIVPPKYDDTLVEGLRIPPNLDTFPAVNFVYTQEPGKLKPKDLKVAIEKSRAERELRALEQKKIREEGGGAGMLDLRGILAEERLNLAEGDPFKRQLREMAFLADADDVEKQEAEKQFRVSEEFVGSLQLSEADVDLVSRQRNQALRHKQREAWRTAQSKQHTALYPPGDAQVKAGASAEVSKRALSTLQPSFDPNRNDIWAKRMNTMRRLVSLVSKWLVRRRLERRMAKVKKCFEGITTKEEAKEFIARENASAKAAGPSTTAGGKANNTTSGTSLDEVRPYSSVAELVCASQSDVSARRQNNEAVIASNRYTFTANMLRRVLFPKFVAEETSARAEMKAVSIEVAPKFDDRTFFLLKSRPEFVSMGYIPHKLPVTALKFSAAKGVVIRSGAAEETVLRPAADAVVKIVDLEIGGSGEPAALAQLRLPLPPPPPSSSSSVEVVGTAAADEIDESIIATPSWLTMEPTWEVQELNFFRTRPEYRTYLQPPARSEIEDTWELRPVADKLEYDEDGSLRSLWLETPGFQSVNRYLLAGHETRSTAVAPPVGPTISDFYTSDQDRHLSGLYCFARDHLRTLVEDDVDIAPPQQAQDKGDVLTDSESDDDEGYVAERPSIARARNIFRDVGSLHENEATPSSPTHLDMSLESDGFGMLSPTKRREEQVELLRDRKTLDLESSLLRQRQGKDKELYKRMLDISNSTKCLVSALPVQAPFEEWEQQLLQEGIMESLLPPLLQSFVQHSGANGANLGALIPVNTLDLAGSPGRF